MGDSWSAQIFRQDGDTLLGPGAFLIFKVDIEAKCFNVKAIRITVKVKENIFDVICISLKSLAYDSPKYAHVIFTGTGSVLYCEENPPFQF